MASQDSRLMYLPELEEIMEDDGVHNLLQEPQYNFSVMTQQRALIAWIGTGRKNDYNAVCKFYHILEEHEATLPMEARLKSQSLEFNSLPTTSPQAEILQQVFPDLYTERRNLMELNATNGRGMPPTETIIPASIAITNYLKSNRKDMATFLNEFKEHTSATGLGSTLNNLLLYIKQKTGDVAIALNGTIEETKDSFDETLNNRLSELFIGDNDSGSSLKRTKIKNSPLKHKHKVYDEEEKENYDAKKNYADVAKNIAMGHKVPQSNHDAYIN